MCLGLLLAAAAPVLAEDTPPKKSAAPPPKESAPAKPAPTAHPGEHPGLHAGDHPHYDYHEFHEHDFHRFRPEEAARWRAGFWRQEWHDGRYGWWWMVDGIWYFYDTPVYPHPLIVSEVVYREPVVAFAAPVGVAPAVQAPVQVMAAPQPQFWYWCDNPQGYSPYVQNCAVPWRQVPAQAAAPVAAAPPAVPVAAPAPAAPAPAAKPAAKPKAAPAPAATNLDDAPPPPPPQ